MIKKSVLHTRKIQEDYNRMADNLFASSGNKETLCIDTYRVIDSCRDRDCFCDAKCYLTAFGQDIIERTDNVRAKYAKVISANIDSNEVPFNNGFYQLNIKMFIKLICEACICPGSIQEFEALCAVEKTVVLYGGEGSVNVFKGQCGRNAFCGDPYSDNCRSGDTMPISVVETVDPIVLNIEVHEKDHPCHCYCSRREIPDKIMACMGGGITDTEPDRILTVSLGIFSVIRIERPSQLLVNAGEYSVPEKQCFEAPSNDPCTIFNGLPFPEKEFNSSQCKPVFKNTRCGC